jgi:hypothetical protein
VYTIGIRKPHMVGMVIGGTLADWGWGRQELVLDGNETGPLTSNVPKHSVTLLADKCA